MLRGGSNYMAGIDGEVGSHWYFPMVSTTNDHNHYRLMSDSYERAGTLGFRCVADLTADAADSADSPSARWSGPPPAFIMLATADASEAPGVMLGTKFVDALITASTAPQATAPVIEWARFLPASTPPTAPDDTASVHTPRSSIPPPPPNAYTARRVRSPAPPGGYTLGSPVCDVPIKPATTGIVVFSWLGAAPPDAPTANATLAAIGCAGPGGFRLSVRAAGKGPQTLALYGGVQGWADGLNVTAMMAGGGAVTQVVLPGATVADSVHHITFEGPPGAVLDVSWALNTNRSAPSPPGPASSAYTYTEYPGVNCFRGHGAIDIDSTPIANLTAVECKARCDDDDTCSCAQYSANGTENKEVYQVGKGGTAGVAPGSCWKRAQCIPDACAKGFDSAKQSVFVKNYFAHPSLNCMDGAGATCLPEPCSAHIVVKNLEACVEHCEADTSCTAALFSAGRNLCWKRTDVVVANCKKGSDWTLLVKPTKAGSSASSAALLYAVTLSDGAMPPMYGF